MIAYTEIEAMGLRIKDLTYPEDWEKDRILKQQLINKEIPFFSMEKRYIKKDGSLTWVYITVSLMEGDALEEDILIGVIQDINSQKEVDLYRKNQEKALEKVVKERTQALVSVNKALIEAHKTKDLVIEELKEAKKALEIMAVEDPLTHLYNRRYMMDQLSKEAERFERYETPFTIIICDIDYFKSINDAYGHNCGDQILVSLSQVLKNALRKIDVLSRWGGEEYLILLPEVDLEAGIFVANRLREIIEKRVFHYLDEILHLTMTFGVASFKTGDTIETLIKNADDALYRGKNSNKNCVMS
jgi:diguanylate cyclase (GGDEF)-like protein/PAS domain S-box-containing protein